MHPVRFGGLDVALRVDNTALVILEMNEDKVFEEYGIKVWPHIHPAKIRDDLLTIQRDVRMNSIGYDRLGTGELIKMFPTELPMHPVISSMPTKQDIIGLIRGMFTAKKLLIHDSDLKREITEQEKYISDAGNILYRHPQGFHDDRFWALGYACYVASKYLIGMPRYIAKVVPKPKSIDQDFDDMLKNI